jgi:hypothetical protein
MEKRRYSWPLDNSVMVLRWLDFELDRLILDSGKGIYTFIDEPPVGDSLHDPDLTKSDLDDDLEEIARKIAEQ